MTKRVKRQIATFLLVTQLAFSLFAPFASFAHLIPQVFASDDTQTAVNSDTFLSFSVEETDSSNQLVVKSNIKDSVELPYSLYYLNDHTTQALKGELVANSENVLFIGTQSNDDFMSHDWQKMVFKVQLGDEVRSYYLQKQTEGELVGRTFVTNSLEISSDDTQWISWLTEADNKTATTIENVVEGQEYLYPFNDKVSVIFTKLPEESGTLTITQLELDEELAEKFGTDVAFDVTTTMENGTFEFDLHLPQPENLENTEAVEVVYADTTADLLVEEKVSKVEKEENGEQMVEVVEEEGVVKAKGLVHMTVFVVVPGDIIEATPDSAQKTGWRIISFGNGFAGLIKVANYGISSSKFGETSIGLKTGSGNDKGFVGYFAPKLTLKSIEGVSWYQYSFSSEDNLSLRIYLAKKTDSEATAYVKVNSLGSAKVWTENILELDGTNVDLYLKDGGNFKLRESSVPLSKLMDKFGDWAIVNFPQTGGSEKSMAGGIVFVAESEVKKPTDSTLSLEQVFAKEKKVDFIIDGITLKIEGESTFFDFTDSSEIIVEESELFPPENLSFETISGTPIQCYGYANEYDIVAKWDAPSNSEDIVYYEYQSFNPPSGWIWPSVSTDIDVYATQRRGGFSVGEGVYGFRVRSVDSEGNRSVWTSVDFENSCQITYDKTAPVITLLSPKDNYYTNQTTVKQEWEADEDTILEYEYQSCWNQPLGQDDCDQIYETTSTVPWRNVNNNNISFWWQVRATDLAGNKGEWSEARRITIDTIPPAVEITSPSDGDVVGGTIDLIGSIVEENMRRYFYRVREVATGQNITSATVYNTLENESFYNWDTTQSNDGEYLIHLAARDLADNRDETVSVANIHVIVDNESPDGSIDYLYYQVGDKAHEINHFKTNDNTPRLGGSCSDNHSVLKVQLTIDGQDQVLDCVDDSWLSDEFEILTNGSHTATLVVTDYAGNTHPYAQEIFVDTVTPNVTHSYYKNEEVITNNIIYVQNVGQLAFDGDYSDTPPSSGLYWDSFVIFDAQSDGTFRFQQSGAKSYCGWRKAPNLVDLTANPIFPDGPISFTNCTESLDDGVYYMAHQVYDSATRKDIPSIFQFRDVLGLKFVVDSVDPESEITFPENTKSGDTVYLTEWDGTILGTAEDLLSGLEKVELEIQRKSDSFYWNGVDEIWQVDSYLNLTSSADEFANWNFSFTPEADEIYYLTSHATDRAGNFEESYEIIVVFDKTIPNVMLTIDPTNPDGSGSWYITKPTITLKATDPSNSGLKNLQYQWDSKNESSWTTVNAVDNEAIKQLQPPKEGHSILYYRATDIAGNTFSETGVKNIYWDATDLTEGPLDVKADPNPTSGSTSTISWTKAEDNIGIAKYKVTWDLRDGDDDHSKEVSGNTTELKISDLQEGTYKVTVTAYDNAGHKKSASTDLVVNRTAPAAPTLTLVDTGVGTATLSWNEVDGADDYIIFYGTEAGNYQYAARVGNITQYTVEGLTAGSYFFVVRAVDNVDNQSPNSNEVNTGAILGAAVAAGPAAGFVEAGDVLGDQTDQEPTEEEMERAKAEAENGEVLGEMISCSPLKNLLPWIILGLQLVILLGAEIVMKRDSSAVKMVIALGTTIVAIALYYLLRNNSCYADGSLTMIIDRFFWLASGLLSVIVRFLGYGFIEVVDKE